MLIGTGNELTLSALRHVADLLILPTIVLAVAGGYPLNDLAE